MGGRINGLVSLVKREPPRNVKREAFCMRQTVHCVCNPKKSEDVQEEKKHVPSLEKDAYIVPTDRDIKKRRLPTSRKVIMEAV